MSFRRTTPGQLLLFWFRPTLVLWALVSAGLMIGIRWALRGWPLIPNYLPFDPGFVIVPLAAVFWGPGGVWAALAGSLGGDAVSGLWGVLTPWRAAGGFFDALTAQQLWQARLVQEDGGPLHLPRWGQTLRFVLAAAPACLVAAGWPAVGADLHQRYPFVYYAGVLGGHYLIFATALGVSLYRIVAREVVAQTGEWREHLALDDGRSRVTFLRGALVLAGALGAPLAGWLTARAVGGFSGGAPQMLGSGGPRAVPIAALAVLALQAAVLLLGGGGARISSSSR